MLGTLYLLLVGVKMLLSVLLLGYSAEVVLGREEEREKTGLHLHKPVPFGSEARAGRGVTPRVANVQGQGEEGREGARPQAQARISSGHGYSPAALNRPADISVARTPFVTPVTPNTHTNTYKHTHTHKRIHRRADRPPRKSSSLGSCRFPATRSSTAGFRFNPELNKDVRVLSPPPMTLPGAPYDPPENLTQKKLPLPLPWSSEHRFARLFLNSCGVKSNKKYRTAR
jgi:hypothetical protein